MDFRFRLLIDFNWIFTIGSELNHGGRRGSSNRDFEIAKKNDYDLTVVENFLLLRLKLRWRVSMLWAILSWERVSVSEVEKPAERKLVYKHILLIIKFHTSI